MRGSLLLTTIAVVAIAFSACAGADSLDAARAAMDDLMAKFWVGSAEDGHIVDTWHCYRREDAPSQEIADMWKADPRGSLWERATCLFCIDNLYETTHDRRLLSRIRAEYRWTSSRYSAQELDSSPGTMVTQCCDDAAWEAMYWMVMYNRLGESFALDRAKGIVESSWRRWDDDTFGGGLFYSDRRDAKSSYQAGLTLVALQIWEITGERSFLKRALGSLSWMDSHLRRPDGLYSVEYRSSGPEGADRPYDINECGSVTFLGGNMAIAVIQARLYEATGDRAYLERAVRTANAIASYESRDGILLNDRDAFSNACFVGDWARLVLPLPGVKESTRDMMAATAASAHSRARTKDGFYMGSWSGPDSPDGLCPWTRRGSKPEQIMVSSNTVNIILAGAAAPRRAD